MKYLYSLLLALILLGACQGEPVRKMEVEGNIQGLKKGTLFLQKLEDSILVTLDSVELRGDGNFGFSVPVESPEIYYLYLRKADNNELNDRITFFGEPGVITINTVWNAFDNKAVIEGSETQKKLEEYQKVMSRFNEENLQQLRQATLPDLINDPAAQDSLQRANERNIRRSYLYALNFAISNPGSHIAPYIALAEVADANLIYLDSVYNALTPEVASGKYGKALKELLEKRKAQ